MADVEPAGGRAGAPGWKHQGGAKGQRREDQGQFERPSHVRLLLTSEVCGLQTLTARGACATFESLRQQMSPCGTGPSGRTPGSTPFWGTTRPVAPPMCRQGGLCPALLML